MNTLRRLIYNEVLRAVAFVALGFLCLFFFFDLLDELQSIGKRGPFNYGIAQALLVVALMVPAHLYELLPIAVLIGTIFVMARLAQSSEYTILRTSGLGPWRALRTLLVLGLGFVLLTFAIGDYVAPAADRAAQLLKARYQGFVPTGGNTGAWLREKRGDRTYTVNVMTIKPGGELVGVRIYEFDDKSMVESMTSAASASVDGEQWKLKTVNRQIYETRDAADEARIEIDDLPEWNWPTGLTSEMVSVALLRPDRMGTVELFNYIGHLTASGQASQRYEIDFWRKVFYPLSCLVMVVLALPFAYLHFRSSGLAGYVFGGVLIGISFFLLNNLFGYIGNLGNWWPWLTAAAPGLIYSVLSLGAFSWLVLRH